MYLKTKENKINMGYRPSDNFPFCKITTLRFGLRDFTLFHIKYCQNYKYGGKRLHSSEIIGSFMVVVSFEPKTF